MSVSSVSLSSDANVRYQRLAQEYSKLRAQAKVLREGVLEERSKVDKLTEEVKSKDALIRRLEAENESLQFRNDQLVRRVESFQLDKPANSPRKPTATSSHETAATSSRVELLEHELSRKLAENARLATQIQENERQHEEELAKMSEKLAKEMRKLEEEVKRMRMRPPSKSGQVPPKTVQVQEDPRGTSEDVDMIASPEPPESQEEARLMVAEAARGTFSAFQNVFSLLKQRSEIYPYDMTMERLPAHVEKLSSEYAQTARLFTDLVAILDGFLARSAIQTDEEIPLVTSKCRLIAQHCNQMLRELVAQITSEECRVSWCSPTLAALNQRWLELVLKQFKVFETLTAALETMGVETVLTGLAELADVACEMLECFQKRWIHEARLPTTTRRMRCVGSALEAALQMTSQETMKLHARAKRVALMRVETESEDVNVLKTPLQNHQNLNLNPFDEEDEVERPTPSEPPPKASTTSEWESKLPVKFPQAPTSSEPEHVAPEVPKLSSKPLPEYSEPVTSSPLAHLPERTSESPNHMLSELCHLTRHNEELQKERDRLFVEYSLMKRKLEIATNDGTKFDPKATDMDLIWACGMERRNEWVYRVQVAETTVRFLELESEVLLRNEIASEELVKRLRVELNAFAEQNQRLEEELDSVRRSYESQLGDLSDHLATLVNERDKDKEGSKSRGSLKSFFNKSSS